MKDPTALAEALESYSMRPEPTGPRTMFQDAAQVLREQAAEIERLKQATQTR